MRNNEESLEVVKFLISKKVHVNKTNKFGQNILNYSADLYNHDVFSYLLKEIAKMSNFSSLDLPLIKTAINGKYFFI